jgi:hypothetical protein
MGRPAGFCTPAAAVQHMGIGHCGSHILMSKKLLDGANVITILQQVSGERMAESMASRPLGETSLFHCLFECFLQNGFIYMMPSFFTGLWVLPAVLLGKDPLPKTNASMKLTKKSR